jgi:hypothetical protein
MNWNRKVERDPLKMDTGQWETRIYTPARRAHGLVHMAKLQTPVLCLFMALEDMEVSHERTKQSRVFVSHQQIDH